VARKEHLYQSHMDIRHASIRSGSYSMVCSGRKRRTSVEKGEDLVSTHSGTPVAIFCIERVPRLDGLLVRYVLLPSLFAPLTCAGAAKRKPFLRRRQRSQCGLSTGAFSLSKSCSLEVSQSDIYERKVVSAGYKRTETTPLVHPY